MKFYCGLVVHITDTRAQKVVSYTSAHITETVFAHDQHWEEQSCLSSPQLYRHSQKHRKWIDHTVRHYTTGVNTCPALRGARHFPSTSCFLCLVFTQCPHIIATQKQYWWDANSETIQGQLLHLAVVAADGCNVIGRHNFLAQKLEANIVCLVSVHCHTHRLASACYYSILPQICTVWCTKLQKLFNAIIGLPGDASDYNEDKRSAVAARMQNKVLVEWGNSESKEWDFDSLGCIEAVVRKYKWWRHCFITTCEKKNFLWYFPFAKVGTSPDGTEQSFSGGMFWLCAGESFRRTVHH